MTCIKIVSEQLVSLIEVRLHQSHHNLMGGTMLVIWICLMSGIDLKSADVCALRIAQGEAFEAPFRRLDPYVLLHMVTSLELDHSFIHRYGLARLPVVLTLFTNNVIQIANFAQAITFISNTRLRALKKTADGSKSCPAQNSPGPQSMQQAGYTPILLCIFYNNQSKIQQDGEESRHLGSIHFQP